MDKKQEEEEEKEESQMDVREPRWDIQNLVVNAAIAQNNWENQDLGLTAPRTAILSPILEMTGESRGSRSGSSSGSSYAASTISSLHGFSKTPGQFSAAGDSRLTFSKTPGQFSCLGDKTPHHLSALGDSQVTSAKKPIRLQLVDLEEDEQDDYRSRPPPLNMSPPKELHTTTSNITFPVASVAQSQETEPVAAERYLLQIWIIIISVDISNSFDSNKNFKINYM